MPFAQGLGNGAWFVFEGSNEKIRSWLNNIDFMPELLHVLPVAIGGQKIDQLELVVTVGLDHGVRRAFSPNAVPQEVIDALTVLKVNAANYRQEMEQFILLVDRYTDPQGAPHVGSADTPARDKDVPGDSITYP